MFSRTPLSSQDYCWIFQENTPSKDIILMGEFCLYNKGNNKIIELRTILQRESQNS